MPQSSAIESCAPGWSATPGSRGVIGRGERASDQNYSWVHDPVVKCTRGILRYETRWSGVINIGCITNRVPIKCLPRQPSCNASIPTTNNRAYSIYVPPVKATKKKKRSLRAAVAVARCTRFWYNFMCVLLGVSALHMHVRRTDAHVFVVLVVRVMISSPYRRNVLFIFCCFVPCKTRSDC